MSRLKERLIDYTTLQVPGTSKPFQLHADVSGYAVGAVLEQKGEPIGFLSQEMTPTQARYPIYYQEIAALVSAPIKLGHLLRVSKITVFTGSRGSHVPSATQSLWAYCPFVGLYGGIP